MIQRLLALLYFTWILLPAQTMAAAASPNAVPPETRFQEGMACLQAQNIDCAALALNRIPSQSVHAKLLAGNIAAAQQDFDSVFRLLLPLKANTSLDNEAAASLHASLALAYEQEPDPLRALEQRVAAERFLDDEQGRAENHKKIWNGLSNLSRDDLVNIRGESPDTDIQGWIDLALAAQEQDDNALKNWPDFYPGHPASKGFSQALLSQRPEAPAPSPIAAPVGPGGKIGVILPFAVEAYYPAADAIEQGFAAAQSQAQDHRELTLYATDGNPANIAETYRRAVDEGVQIALGPLTRDEVTRLGQQDLGIPTLALNQPDSTPGKTPNLYIFGLPLEGEIAQLVRLAQRLGMQTATIAAGSNHLAERMAQAFGNAWNDAGGRITQQLTFAEDSNLTELQAKITSNPSDLIFLAANYEEARVIRPHLDTATPTFATSHIYAGIPQDPENEPLNAVRFVDMPWLLEPESAAFANLRPAASDLPPGEMQRWFALGVDAYRILDHVSKHPQQAHTLQGLTGKISISSEGNISRELASGRFSAQGVVPETTP
ncbi:penicillin-binding protein activator [Methylobacillus flagellatus]|uniref:penicillin-binding protein activator n=1 Tax=Methylobacillus flagellatus TaxID=405 RepID=UPI002853F698|nr:penicillin-binding protein activator [Methylobacillus flagellatus]MDR5172329.1 penicillin-binding protein activator [Methylobacillus flagellatus]